MSASGARSRRERDYSKTPLSKKLGIKPGSHVALVNEPDDLLELLQPLPEGVALVERASRPLEVIVLFARTRDYLGRRLPFLKTYLARDGGLWVAYPKKSSKIEGDLTFESVQQMGLNLGLVDNKSCAIDADWTAVRFVYRVSDRG